MDHQIDKSVRSTVISNCGGRRVHVSLIVVEVPHSLLAVDLIFNILRHSQLWGLSCFLIHALVEDPQAVDLMAYYIQQILDHKVIGL